MPNYGRDLATGMAIGEKLMGNINQGIATRKRTALREEVDKGLVQGEDGSYDYLGKKFQYEPSRYERSALEAEKRATLEEDWGDQERADAYRAITQGYIEKDLDHRTRQVLASGNPAQAVDLWNQHNPDRMARWENNQLLFSPRGREDWLPVYSGDPQGAMEFIGSQYSPAVVKEMADARLKAEERAWKLANTKSEIAARNDSSQRGWADLDYKGSEAQMKQMEYAVKGMEAEAKRLEEAGEIDQASAMRQQIQQAQRGLTRGSGGGGGGSGGPPGWLRASESGGKWNAENDAMGAGGMRGHYGQGQFGHARLQEASKALGVQFTPDEFMRDPKLQQQVWAWHENDIKQHIQDKGYDTSGGLKILGTPMTYGAMLGVAHLGGKQGLDRFIETGGAYNKADRNGTRLSDYARKGYTGEGASPRDAAPTAEGGLTRAPQAPARPTAGTYGPGEYVSKMLGTPAQTAYARGLEEINATQYSPDPALNAKLRNDKLWALAEGLGVPAKFRQQANQDANAALSAKLAKDKKPSAPPTEPNAFLDDIRTGLQTEGADKEAAQAKAGLERGVGRTLDSLGWYADNKNSPSVKAQAAKALEEIRGVLPDLSPQGVETARKAAEGLFRIFPDLK